MVLEGLQALKLLLEPPPCRMHQNDVKNKTGLWDLHYSKRSQRTNSVMTKLGLHKMRAGYHDAGKVPSKYAVEMSSIRSGYGSRTWKVKMRDVGQKRKCRKQHEVVELWHH